VPARISFDMWSLGCVLFQLLSGEPLWLANDEDNLTESDNLRALYEWTNVYKVKKLSKISDKNARNLCSQLLNFNPARRPATMPHVLAHPFFTGHTASRLPGDEAEFDVFLSYRVDSDSEHVEQLHNLLVAKGIKVWWDKKCLSPGINWEAGFCKGLVLSTCFVPLLSRKAIKNRFEALCEDSRCDNVLLEYRLAIELFDRGLLERVFPVMIGDFDASTDTYGNYFRQGCHPSPSPDIIVRSLESKLLEHLEGQGLGLAHRDGMSVFSIVEAIMVNQGGFVEGFVGGNGNAPWEFQAETIAKMVRETRAVAGTIGAREEGGYGALTLSEELQEAIAMKNEAEKRIEELMAKIKAID